MVFAVLGHGWHTSREWWREEKKCGSRHPSLFHCIQLQPSPFHCVQPLKRRTFCAQDIFNVESTITSFGSPHWEKTHEAATKTVSVLETLKKNGAHFIGKTVMDELGFTYRHGFSFSWSLSGKNRWLEIPKNPSASYLICGGSSSGSAIAAASDVVDFALGIDTVGDTRVPAACCGVLGFRVSHGVISMVGIIPVVSSLRCCGLVRKRCWYATPCWPAIVYVTFRGGRQRSEAILHGARCVQALIFTSFKNYGHFG